MELYKLSSNIYYSSYEELRDRPSLGYIKGSKFSIAIDAGHSDDQGFEFYNLLKKEDLPLPTFTVITHWHWDHSFGIHAINGLAIANKKTNEHLIDFIKSRSKENDAKFLQLDSSIALEYKDNKPIVVKKADIVFEKEIIINNGIEDIRIFECISPHCDDATFVYAPKEKVLFIGDGKSGVFPTWIADKKTSRQLAKEIEKMDIDYCIGGHWPIESKKELLTFLYNENEG